MLKVKGTSLVRIGNMLGLFQCCDMVAKTNRSSFPKSFSFTVPPADGPQTHTFNFGPSEQKETQEEEKPLTVASLFPDMVEWLEELAKDCDDFSLRLSSKLIRRFLEDVKERGTEIGMELFSITAAEIVGRVQDELADIVLLRVHKKPELFNVRFPFGEEVAAKLPSMAEDAQEAATCLSLERWTASVFHLMRVVEIGVQKFGDKIGISLTTEKNWQNILDEVNKAIKKMDPKNELTKQYASLAAHLYNVKLAWRNEVMHPKATYTEQEADEIYLHVDTFIRNIAKIAA
jgi:hypothetical protein